MTGFDKQLDVTLARAAESLALAEDIRRELATAKADGLECLWRS